MSGEGVNKQVADRKKVFVVFPSMIGSIDFKVSYINNHDGNWVGWHTTDAAIQNNYRNAIAKIKARFTDEFENEK